MTVTQFEDLDRLDNQWCWDLDEQWVYNHCYDGAVDAIKLLYAQCIEWKKNDLF